MAMQAAIEASARARHARTLVRLATGRKLCPRCQADLPLAEEAFYSCPGRAGNDGLSALCGSCSQAAVYERRGKPHSSDAACASEQLTVRHSRHPQSRTGPSQLTVPLADLSRGLCATLPSQSRAWWTSDRHDEQWAAQQACQSCPVLDACHDWAVSVGDFYTSGAVWAGLTQAELRRQRRRFLDDVAGQVRQ
jgi:Transcription factor WhiB